MKGVQNFLLFLNDNWTTILVCIGIIVGLVEKTKSYFSKSKEERIDIAKKQIQETILEMITNAEIDFSDWNKSGEIKRSQVIKQIFAEYPVLSKVANQSEIIEFIDNAIKQSLKTLREVVKENEDNEN